MPADVEEGGEKAQGHQRSIDDEREQQPGIFSNQEFPAADGLGQQAIKSALLHFLVNEADADEDGHDQTEDGDGREAEVNDYEALDADGNLADENRRADHHQGEKNQVVEDAVANRFAKGVHGDHAGNGDASGAHRVFTSTA